jgi:hypothetical protein
MTILYIFILYFKVKYCCYRRCYNFSIYNKDVYPVSSQLLYFLKPKHKIFKNQSTDSFTVTCNFTGGGFRDSYHIQSNARITFDNRLKVMRKGTLS